MGDVRQPHLLGALPHRGDLRLGRAGGHHLRVAWGGRPGEHGRAARLPVRAWLPGPAMRARCAARPRVPALPSPQTRAKPASPLLMLLPAGPPRCWRPMRAPWAAAARPTARWRWRTRWARRALPLPFVAALDAHARAPSSMPRQPSPLARSSARAAPRCSQFFFFFFFSCAERQDPGGQLLPGAARLPEAQAGDDPGAGKGGTARGAGGAARRVRPSPGGRDGTGISSTGACCL